MAGTTPYVVVDAPEPRALRYGLLLAANGPLPLPVHALAGGVTYSPVGCGKARQYTVTCHTSNEAKTFDARAAVVERDPTIVYAALKCPPVGTSGSDQTDLATRNLTDGEQTIAEQILAGLMSAEATPVTPPDTTSLTSVVAELEQSLHGQAPDSDYGYVGYLHASPRLAAYAAAATLIVRDGTLLRTPLGTIWVFGGGYPDLGVIYATGQPTVWRAEQPAVASELDRETNQISSIAEREYAVSYDCVCLSAEFDWTVTS